MKAQKMKTATHIFAGRLAMTLLAIFATMPLWAQLSGKGTADSPYLINNAGDWKTFTDNVNNGIGTSAYYKLTSDIALGTKDEPLDTVVGTDNKFFRGNFDGDYHTINIIMDRKEKYAAPFGVTDGATISNLKVTGTITTTNKFAGGIIAYANNKSGKSTNLINCRSSIHIICDGIETVITHKPYDCTHGGLVGQNETGTLNFENCIFDGWIKDFSDEKRANKCTGFVAWVNNTVNYTNCVMAGTLDVKPNDDDLKNSMANYHRLANNAKAYFHGNCYYLIDYTYPGLAEQGVQAYTEAPENTISGVYNAENKTYYVPGAVIDDDVVTFYGWTLTKGTDYVVGKVSTSADNKMVYKGINNYGGAYAKDVPPTYQINVTTWDASTKTGWYAISSPVDGQTFATTNHLTLAAKHNIYRYDEEQRMWQEYRNEANLFDSFENGRGYIYRTEENGGTIGFNGETNSGDVKCALSYNEKTDHMSGLNLIGNPYTHDIYKSVAIPNDMLSNGYCYLTVNGTWVYKADTESIPAGTAVMVQATAESKGDRTIILKDTDKAPTSKRGGDEIWFTVNNQEYSDVAHVEFGEGLGFNKINHQNDEAPMLYVKHNGEKFASANLNEETQVFDLSFEAKTMGKYTLSFNADGSFDYLHLIDRMTGEDVDMLIEDEYSFISSDNDNADRFIVKMSNNATSNYSVTDVFAWQSGNEIVVKGEGELQVFDMAGRLTTSTTIRGEETINGLSNGVYVFRMIGNEVKTQKVVVR